MTDLPLTFINYISQYIAHVLQNITFYCLKWLVCLATGWLQPNLNFTWWHLVIQWSEGCPLFNHVLKSTRWHFILCRIKNLTVAHIIMFPICLCSTRQLSMSNYTLCGTVTVWVCACDHCYNTQARSPHLPCLLERLGKLREVDFSSEVTVQLW
jgi:hypothetical protein